MIVTSARLALRDVLSPAFRATLWKMLGLAILVLIALWYAVTALADAFAIPFLQDLFAGSPDWVSPAGTFAAIAGGLFLALVLAYLIGPVSAMIAGLFLDDVAELVERYSYPEAPVGTAMPLVKGAILSAKFFGIVILGNLFALALLLVPGVNLIAFFVVNGYLLGREYFEFAALRYWPESEAKAMRQRHSGTVSLAGFIVAAFLAVPIVNLLTPLFAASFMVHLHQRLARKEGGLPRIAGKDEPVTPAAAVAAEASQSPGGGARPGSA